MLDSNQPMILTKDQSSLTIRQLGDAAGPHRPFRQFVFKVDTSTILAYPGRFTSPGASTGNRTRVYALPKRWTTTVLSRQIQKLRWWYCPPI